MPKIGRIARLIIVGSIGLIFILFGIVQAIFHFTIDRSIVDNVSFVLMGIAVLVFFYGRGKKNEDSEKQNSGASKEEEKGTSDSDKNSPD